MSIVLDMVSKTPQNFFVEGQWHTIYSLYYVIQKRRHLRSLLSFLVLCMVLQTPYNHTCLMYGFQETFMVVNSSALLIFSNIFLVSHSLSESWEFLCPTRYQNHESWHSPRPKWNCLFLLLTQPCSWASPSIVLLGHWIGYFSVCKCSSFSAFAVVV